MNDNKDSLTIVENQIEDKILLVRGHKVMLDNDLAEIYGVETRVLNQAVKRNLERFPNDFMFQLTENEYLELKNQSQFVIGSQKHRDPSLVPYAFTEHGAVMLATILRSQTAIEASIQVVREFVRLRNILSEHKELAEKIEKLEDKYDEKFKIVFAAIKQLMSPIGKDTKQIGFISKKD